MPNLLPCPFCGIEAKASGYGLRGCTACNIWMLEDEWNRRQPYLEPQDLETLQMILSELNPMFSRHAALRAIIAKLEGKP